MNYLLILVYGCLASFCVAAADWSKPITSKIDKIGTGWVEDSGCVYLESGDVVRLDLNSVKGRAQLSIALTAKSRDESIRVSFDLAGVAVGDCDTGQTILPHGLFRMEG